MVVIKIYLILDTGVVHIFFEGGQVLQNKDMNILLENCNWYYLWK